MTRPHPRRFALERDDGAILVLALIIVTTIALVVGTVLTRGDGSLRATVALREVAGSTYAADGAAQVAINDLRTGQGFAGNEFEHAFNNSLDGVGCFGNNVGVLGTDKLELDNFYPAVGSTSPTSAVVECTGEAKTGQLSAPVPMGPHNKPPYALITLGGPVDASASKDPGLNVRGGVSATGAVMGQVAVTGGELKATGSCDGTVTASPESCNSSTPATDPGYAPDLGGVVPPLQTPPTSCSSGVAIFEPGYYDNAATLNAATNLCSVAWFKPGPYYFDFHNASCADICPANLFSAGDGTHTWSISGETVIGGTPINASGSVISQPPAGASVPGACASPIDDTHTQGVQFVFGGDSRIYIDKDSQVELCGTYHSTRPPIVLFGLKSGTTPTATTSTALTADSPPSAGAFTGATAAALAAAGDTKVATWTTAATGKQSTTLTAQGFHPAATVPAGSILTAATLHITHKDVAGSADSAGTATVTIGGATTAGLPVPASAAMTTTDLPIGGDDLKSLQQAVHDGGFTGASVSYTAKANTKVASTATLDAITLDLTYHVPVLRGQSGCIADTTAAGCPFWSMKGGNNKAAVYFQGTVYVPAGDINFQLGNFSTAVANFGVIARQLEFAIVNGDIRWKGPAIEIPDDAPGYGYENTTVDLTVHLCPGQPTCTTAAPVALTARVQLWDPSGYPAPPGRQVSILSWSEQR